MKNLVKITVILLIITNTSYGQACVNNHNFCDAMTRLFVSNFIVIGSDTVITTAGNYAKLPATQTFTGVNTFSSTANFTVAGAGSQTAININSGVTSSASVFSSGLNIDEDHSGVSGGTVNSLYGIRINMHTTGTDTTIDLIGTKYNIPDITHAGKVVNYTHIFLTSPDGSGATTNSCINILGTGYGLSWSYYGNAPEQGFSQPAYRQLELSTNNFAINNTPASFQAVSYGGDVFSSTLGIGVYTNHRIVATQNSANLYALYIGDTYSDSSFSGTTHWGIYQTGNAINNFTGPIHSNSTDNTILNGPLLTAANTIQFSGLNIASQSMNFLENTGQMYIGWNYSAGDGETDMFANRGGGTAGGFEFFDVDNSGTVTALSRLGLTGFALASGTFSCAAKGGGTKRLTFWDESGIAQDTTMATLGVMGSYVASGTGSTATFTTGVPGGYNNVIVMSNNSLATVQSATLTGSTLNIVTTAPPTAGVNNIKFTYFLKP